MRGIWLKSMFSRARPVSYQMSQGCNGSIFENEIYGTHMVIAALLAKIENVCQSAGPTPLYIKTHTCKHVHKQTSKRTLNQHIWFPTVCVLQLIHLPQLSEKCQKAFQNSPVCQDTHTLSHWCEYSCINKPNPSNMHMFRKHA